MTTWDKLANVKLWAAPFNGPDDPDASINWVDITYPYLLLVGSGQPVNVASGRQSEWQDVNVGTFSATLNNADGRFTPGNTSSPYYPGWRPGMRLRMTETIGYQTFTMFDGNMLQPEVVIQLPSVDQTLVINGTDRLGRLQQARTLVSTLAEYIIFNGGSSLKAHYPLNDGGLSFRDVVGGNARLHIVSAAPNTLVSTGPPIAGVQTGPAIPGDDISTLRLIPNVSNLTVNGYSWVDGRTGPFTTSGATLAVTAWMYFEDVANDGPVALQLSDATGVTNDVLGLSANNVFGTGRVWSAFGSVGAAFATFPVTGPRSGAWNLITLRLTLPSLLVECCCNADQPLSATMTGGSPTTTTLNDLTVGTRMQGNFAHAQVYLGSSISLDHAAHLAQYRAAFDGLANQYTGQRITTIAQYAGVAVGDMDIDAGTSRMQKATLAGRSPLDVMQEAATTEQGLLHAAGRRLLFHDRLRRYNR